MSQLSQRLKELRLENHLLQKDLAGIFGVNSRTVSNWECNVNVPDYDTLVAIAKYFNVSTDYLLGKED